MNNYLQLLVGAHAVLHYILRYIFFLLGERDRPAEHNFCRVSGKTEELELRPTIIVGEIYSPKLDRVAGRIAGNVVVLQREPAGSHLQQCSDFYFALTSVLAAYPDFQLARIWHTRHIARSTDDLKNYFGLKCGHPMGAPGLPRT